MVDLVGELTVRLAGPGGPVEVPLTEGLCRSNEFTGVASEVPTMLPVVLRQVLVPVVMAALGEVNMPRWGQMLAAGQFTTQERDAISGYLADRAEAFDLTRFGQVPDLAASNGQTQPVTQLMPHVASGNNVPLRGTATDGAPVALPLAQAARWALHAHCWDTAMLKTGAGGDPQVKGGKTAGNPIGMLGRLGVVVPQGSSLFETIMLNLPAGGRIAGDVPQWERTDCHGPAWTTRAPVGPLDLLTWQGRRVRLFPERTASGEWVVRRALLCGGDRMDAVPGWEPHTAWRIKNDPRTGTARFPHKHLVGRDAWQGLDALLARDRDSANRYETSILLAQVGAGQVDGYLPWDFPLRVSICGIAYGTMAATVEEITADQMPLPVAALRADTEVAESVAQIAAQADRTAQAVTWLATSLRLAAGADPYGDSDEHRPGAAVLYELGPLVGRMLAGLQAHADDWELVEQAHTAFEVMCARVALQEAARLHTAAGPGVFAGRQRPKPGSKNTETVLFRQADAHRQLVSSLRKILPRYAATLTAKDTTDATL